jgi:hypothetical protein
MPRKGTNASKRSNGGTKDDTGSFGGPRWKTKWVDFSYNEREAILSYAAERVVDFATIIQGLGESGVKISFSNSAKNDRWYCTLTPRAEHRNGYDCFVLQHNDLTRLGEIAMYVVDHYVADGEVGFPEDNADFDW